MAANTVWTRADWLRLLGSECLTLWKVTPLIP